MQKKNLSISILNVEELNSFLFNLKQVEYRLKQNKQYNEFLDINIHFDVMDNEFVENNGVNINKIKSVKDMGFYVDTHLMVKNPIQDKYIDLAISLGSDEIIIHYEIEDFENVFNYLKEKKEKLLSIGKNFNIGIAIKPITDILEISKYFEYIDKLLVMTVEPGFGGQKYIEEMNKKISYIKEKNSDVKIQIDGGVNLETFIEPARNDVDSFAIGSDVTKYSDDLEMLYNKILSYNITFMLENLPKDSNILFDKKILQIVEGGYGENDILLGIKGPKLRDFSNKIYKDIPNELLDFFMKSKYHEYRKLGILCISNNIKKNKIKNDMENETKNKNKEEKFEIFESNLEYINNWDLTDGAGPNILAYKLLELDEVEMEKEILKYINSENMWIKRIGIVSLITLVKKGYIDFSLKICDIWYYENYHLMQKATGWVLREVYKKEPEKLVEYLIEKSLNKKTPSILLSYACEKMSVQEKDKIRKINNK